MKKAVIGLILITVVLGVTLTACGKSKSNEEQVLMNGEYVSESDAAAMEKAEAKAAEQAAKDAAK